jgi:hypothetical protein
MRLFRVEQEWFVADDGTPSVPHEDRHMLVRKGAEGPGVYFGHGAEDSDLALPVGKDLAKPFEDNEELESLPLRAARLGTEPYRLLVPTRDELSKLERGSYYGDCLVHVCLPRTENCSVIFKASTYTEHVMKYKTYSRVEREYQTIEEAIGVQTIFIAEDGHEAIFSLHPGASFRICRDEATVPKGESPVLVFAFDGRTGNCFRPKKFKPRSRKRPNRRRKKEEVVSAAYGSS